MAIVELIDLQEADARARGLGRGPATIPILHQAGCRQRTHPRPQTGWLVTTRGSPAGAEDGSRKGRMISENCKHLIASSTNRPIND